MEHRRRLQQLGARNGDPHSPSRCHHWPPVLSCPQCLGRPPPCRHHVRHALTCLLLTHSPVRLGKPPQRVRMRIGVLRNNPVVRMAGAHTTVNGTQGPSKCSTMVKQHRVSDSLVARNAAWLLLHPPAECDAHALQHLAPLVSQHVADVPGRCARLHRWGRQQCPWRTGVARVDEHQAVQPLQEMPQREHHAAVRALIPAIQRHITNTATVMEHNPNTSNK